MNTTTSLRPEPWGVEWNKKFTMITKSEGWGLTKNPYKLELTSPSRDLIAWQFKKGKTQEQLGENEIDLDSKQWIASQYHVREHG